MSNEAKPTLVERLAKGRGETVRKQREALGWSQVELAAHAGTTQQTVDRIERGVVEHSRAYPRICKVLDIPNEGFDRERIDQQLEAVKADSEASYRRFMTEGKVVSEIADDARIPILTFGPGDRYRLVNSIPRGFPVEFTEGAFAVIMFGSEMEPALRNGELAVINPHLPPMWQSEVLATLDNRPTVRTFMGETEEHWLLKQWNPVREIKLAKADCPKLEMVVAKVSRSV